jgi:hypothetical protein
MVNERWLYGKATQSRSSAVVSACFSENDRHPYDTSGGVVISTATVSTLEYVPNFIQ